MSCVTLYKISQVSSASHNLKNIFFHITRSRPAILVLQQDDFFVFTIDLKPNDSINHFCHLTFFVMGSTACWSKTPLSLCHLTNSFIGPSAMAILMRHKPFSERETHAILAIRYNYLFYGCYHRNQYNIATVVSFS